MENAKETSPENSNVSLNITNATTEGALYTMVTERLILHCVISPIIIVVGLAGNIATLIVIRRIKERNSTSQFLISLAVSDIMTLCVRTMYMVCVWAQLFCPDYFLKWKLNSFTYLKLAYTSERISKNIIVAIVIERVLAVMLPLKVRIICTRRRTAGVILAIFLLVSASSVPDTLDVLIYDYYTESKDPTFPMTQKEAKQYLSNRLYKTSFQATHNTVNRFILDFLPIPLVLIGNILIINGLRRSANNFATGNNVKLQRKATERNLTHSLLMVSVCFLVLCTPFDFYAFAVLTGLIRISNSTLVSSEVFKMGTLINCSINFLIYAFMNKRYKKEYKYLICPCINRKKDNNERRINISSLSQNQSTGEI